MKKKSTVPCETEEKIIDAEYSSIMQKSYIDYAMSVITARAIPDIRDGLKPVQRRTIYDMDELGAASSKPYRKSARIVGDAMGKYHPHGDSSIYDALVVMTQDFKKSVPIIDGHGNFGSIEGDGAAASRYTEARLADFTEQVFLQDLDNNAVDFVPNYDKNEKEPVVLPCRLPNFLINGSEGIAVGMATSVPPHNVSEAIDAAVYFLEHSDAGSSEILEILHGPDFPTGGIVTNKQELLSIYETGTGKLRIRGRIVFEKGKGSEKDRLVVTEIPYTMIGDGIGKFLQSVADLAENRTLTEIADITNQTSSDGIRIVLELKKGADAEYVKSVLYKKTRLEDTFGVNMLAVHDGKPEVMNLQGIMQAYVGFQYEIYTRKFTFLLEKTERRIEVLEGMIQASEIIELIVEILRKSANIKQAKACMMDGDTEGISFSSKTSQKKAASLRFTEIQADAILSMTLSRLIALELSSLEKELLEKQKLSMKYKKLLSDRKELKKEIKKQLLILKEKFGRERRTEIVDEKPAAVEEREEKEQDIAVLVDKFYYVHAADLALYEKNEAGMAEDYRYIIKTTNKAKLAVFCNSGKAHIVRTGDIPYGKLKDKGQPLDNICNYDSREETVAGIAATKSGQMKQVFISTNGLVKIVNMEEFDVSRKTVDATKLKNDGKFLCIQPYIENGWLTLGTKNGMYIRFRQNEIPEMKRNAVGAAGIRLADGDEVLYAVSSVSESALLKTDSCEFETGKVKAMRRGGKGTKTKAAKIV